MKKLPLLYGLALSLTVALTGCGDDPLSTLTTTKDKSGQQQVVDPGTVVDGIPTGAWLDVDDSTTIFLFQGDSLYTYVYNSIDSTVEEQGAVPLSLTKQYFTANETNDTLDYYDMQTFVPYGGTIPPSFWVLQGTTTTTTKKTIEGAYILVAEMENGTVYELDAVESEIYTFIDGAFSEYWFDGSVVDSSVDFTTYSISNDTLYLAEENDVITIPFQFSNDTLYLSIQSENDAILLPYTGKIPHDDWTAPTLTAESIIGVWGVWDTLYDGFSMYTGFNFIEDGSYDMILGEKVGNSYTSDTLFDAGTYAVSEAGKLTIDDQDAPYTLMDNILTFGEDGYTMDLKKGLHIFPWDVANN